MSNKNLSSVKILVVAANKGYDVVFLDKILPAMKSIGLNFSYAGWDREKELQKSFYRDGILFRMVFRGWGYANRSLYLGLPLWMIRIFWFLLFDRHSLVMAVNFDTGLPMALVNMITGKPYIYNIRDNFSMTKRIPRMLVSWIEKLDNWIIKRSVSVVVPDENRVTSEDESLKQKFVIIRNCALDVSDQVKQNILSKRPFTVYAMGYLGEDRGVGILLDTVEQMPDLRVLLAGKIYSKELEDRIKSLASNVEYRGVLPPVEALKLCFDSDVIFAFYSPDAAINLRAISNKWSDAMMASKPILMNEEVDKSQWIKENDIGYTCLYSVQDLTLTLKHIMNNPDEARAKGMKGRRIFEDGYNWSAMEKRYRNLFENIADTLHFDKATPQ